MFNEERTIKIDDGDQQLRECNSNTMMHVHSYHIMTKFADDHQHMLMGVCEPADKVGVSHVHRLASRTSFVTDECRGHWHWGDIVTGGVVSISDDSHMHTHYISGRTSVNDDHYHDFEEITNSSTDTFGKRDEEHSLSPKLCKYKYNPAADDEYN